MSWDHPLVTGLMDSILSQELGNTAVAAWESELSKEPLVIECSFAFETRADAKWNLAEFFAPPPVRVVLDGPGTDLTSKWGFVALQEAIGPLPPQMAGVPKRLPSDGLRKLIGKAKDVAETQAKELRATADRRMNSAIDKEIARLEALRSKNRMVSSREIQWWKDRRVALADALLGTRVRLDSFLLVLPRTLGSG
jgi:ATP-dependent helicase HepA